MIKNLSGDYETVEYENKRYVMLYDNVETENYPFHWHNAVEIIMPIQNGFTVSTGDKTFELDEREIIIIPPGELHTMPPRPGRRFIFQCDNTVLGGTAALESVMPVFSSALLITSDTDKELHSFAQKCILDIYSEYMLNSSLADTKIYVHLIELMIAIREYQLKLFSNEIARCDSKHMKYNEKISQVLRYIDKNYMHDISLEKLADIAGYSKYHFSRIFKQFSSVSYIQYINKKRTKAAELLLMNPDIPITEAAKRSGFSSLTTFNRIFKEIKHCTPSAFKRIYLNASKSGKGAFTDIFPEDEK